MSNSRSTIVAFQSVKTSVGQTLALAEVANLLAKWKRKVLVVDCDLQNRGLEKLVVPQEAIDGVDGDNKAGFFGLLHEVAQARRTDWRARVKKAKISTSEQSIDLLPAGRISGKALNSILDSGLAPWSMDGVSSYLEALRSDWQSEYDVVLLDVKPSLAIDESRWALRVADAMVVLLTTQEDQLEHAAFAIDRQLESFPAESTHRKCIVVPVTAKYDGRAGGRLESAWTLKVVSVFRKHYEQWAPGVAASVLAEKLKIGHVPEWNWQTPKLESTRAATKSIESLARLIAHHFDWTRVDQYPAQWMPQALDNDQRQKCLLAEAEAQLTEADGCLSDGRTTDAISLVGMAIASWRQCDEHALAPNRERIYQVKTLLLDQLSVWRCDVEKSAGGNGAALISQKAYTIALAGALSNLSRLMSHVREPRVAIDALRAAVELRRGLSTRYRSEYETELARSLHNLAKLLAEAGDHHHAVEAAAESVAIRRRLARIAPVSHTPALARSLSNLAARFQDQGDSQKALIAMREAIVILRRLTRLDVVGAKADLARALSNLATVMAHRGDNGHAAAVTWEAVRIWMRLNREDSNNYTFELAQSFHRFALLLAAGGHGLMSVTAAERAVKQYRRLVHKDAEKYEPYLARALNTLSNRLAAEGYHRRALREIEEAVAIRSRLVQSRDQQFDAELAQSLNNFSNRVAATGNWLKALDVIDKAVDIRTRLAREDRNQNGRDLMVSLYNKSLRLVEADEGGMAMMTVKNSLLTLRQLLSDGRGVR